MKKHAITLACMLLLFSVATAIAQQGGNDEEADSTDTFAELIEGTTHQSGFIDTYTKDGKLYMAIPKDKLDREFLMNHEIARGIGSSGLYGGTMLNYFEGKLVAFEKHEGKIFLVQKPHRYKAEANTPEALAVDLAYSPSVLETAEIAATSEDSVMLIDTYSWFVSDLSNISQRVQGAAGGRVTVDPSRSYMKSVKSFPDNTAITASLTFANQNPGGPRTVPDTRYIPVSIHYNLAKLPEQPMETRMADDRTGYFMTVHKDFTTEDETFFKRYVNRWRLECEDAPGSDGLCTPREPIVYYIDRTVPEEFREAMMEGVEAWSDAFEAAGFRNAVQADMLPEGADPADIRYATLRWSTSDQPGYGAIGPSIVDPRTGEIMDADILFEANMILGDKEDYREMVEPRNAIDEMYNRTEEELELMRQGVKTQSFFVELHTQLDMARGVMMARGVIEPGSPVPKEFLDQAIRWVTMHEVGHTLGLTHNFRSSIDTPLDQLYNEDFTSENGVFSSAMEYPTVNVNPQGEGMDGHYWNPGVGSYDRWVVSYGYTPDQAEADEIARNSALPGHAYGTDTGGPDPHVNTYDLSSDPLAWGRERAEMLRGLIPRVPEIAMADNIPFYEATDLFQSYFFQYARALAPTVKYIGGQHNYRDHMGDPQGRMPFVPVPREEQVEALDMIVEYAFQPGALNVPQEVFQQFGANRWSHWGSSTSYGGRSDYPLHQTMLGIQQSLLNQLLDGERLSRIRDTEAKFGAENTVTIPELMGRLTNAIWQEVWSAPGRNVDSNRRDLQRAHLEAMIAIVTEADDEMTADAKSVARMQLRDLSTRLDSRLSPPTYEFDDYTRAHLEEARARIDKALEAGLSLEN